MPRFPVPAFRRSLILILLGSACAMPAVASTDPADIAAAAYVRARAADVLGDLQDSAAGYATAMAIAPGDLMLAQRTYRQALAAGDRALAVRAAQTLDAAGKLPPDARLLLVTEDVATRNWAAATAQIDGIDKDGLFTFLSPVLRAWVAFGARSGDPMALLDQPVLALAPGGVAPPAAAGGAPAPVRQAASPYLAEHRALLLFAQGKTDEGLAATRALLGSGQPQDRLRLYAAGALQRDRRKAEALEMLAGDGAVLIAARAQIEAGRRLFPQAFTAADGLAELYLHVAADVQQQRVSPLAVSFARLATFVAPRNEAGWLATAELLAEAGRIDAAGAALANVTPTGIYAQSAEGIQLRLLMARGDKAAALAEVQARAAQPTATSTDLLRLGDLYSDLDRPKEAVDAYGRALTLARASGGDKDAIWPILLLQGGAQEKAGEWEAAKTTLAAALELAPDQPVLLNYMGYIQLERRENLPAAQKLVERASALQPDNASITDSLGWAYYLNGDLPKAIDTLERASRGDPAEPTINEHLGDAYWAAGRRYEARYAWRAALIQAEDDAAKRISAKIDGGLSKATAAP